MPVPKRKLSKMKTRQRKGANRYEGVQPAVCTVCGKPAMPHRVCGSCGNYKGKQIVAVKE